MSDNEEEIWGYKSIRKHKAPEGNRTASQEPARRSGVQAKRGGSRKRNAPKKTKNIQTPPSPISPAPRPAQGPDSPGDVSSTPKRKKAQTGKTPIPVTPPDRHSGHCPSCQMPFSILLVQSPRWHVSECLDAQSTAQTDCPAGVRCSSTLPSHYKRYSHFLLAQSRAVDQPWFSPPCTPDLTNKLSLSNGFSPTRAETSTTKKMMKLKSPQSRSPSSSQESVKRTSLETWLSSPSKSSQETYSHVNGTKCFPRPQQDMDLCDSAISYSPLFSDHELSSEDEGNLTPSGRTPHPNKSSPDNSEAIKTSQQSNNSNEQAMGGPRDASGSTCVRPPPARAEMMEADYWSERCTPVSGIGVRPPAQLHPEGAADDNQFLVFPIKTEGDVASFVASQPHALMPRLQETLTQSSQVMSSAPSAKAMKQMDIGAFFGFKPKPKAVATAADVKGPLKNHGPKAVASQSEKPPRKRKATGSLGDASAVVENVGGIVVPAATGTQKRGGKRFRQNSTGEQRGKKPCPFYKKIPGTGFTVDAFQYGEIEGCSAYFLTHFHSDHYGGLTKKFRFPIYCSKITGNLVQNKLRVEEEFITCLPMYTECTVNGIKVVLLDANHCPGAALLLFILPNGTSILHTGDFRAEPSMERYPALRGRRIHTLYLDTTYCSPEYTFPPQQETVQFAVNAAFEMVTLHPRTLVVCGTYSVGKERVFLAIADVLGCKVSMSQDKYKTMQCLESDEIRAVVTTDWHSTALHVLPMMQVNFKGLYAHLNKFSGTYDRVLAFKPTGWTYSQGCSSVAEIRPEVRGKVTMYGIPYSEHSSFSEMKRFVQFLKPQKIIPTVNVGNRQARDAMEKYFAEWLSETRR